MLAIVLTISIIFFTLLFAVALKRHFLLSKIKENNALSPVPLRFASLFAPDAKTLTQIQETERRSKLKAERERILAWASLIDFLDLRGDALRCENKQYQSEALGILTERAERCEDVCALVRFVLDHQNFDVNQKLIIKFSAIWEKSPDLTRTIELFDLALRADDAELFQSVFVVAEQAIQTGQLSDLNLSELRELASSHFWLLSPNARMSGAGFWLKQKLAR